MILWGVMKMEKKQGENRPEKLNIYAQDMWHDEALVLSTEKGLRDLRSVIDKALKEGSGVLEATASDGDKYNVHVVVKEEDEGAWRDVSLPYTEDVAQNGGEKGKQYIISKVEDKNKGGI